jgi:NTE family protein
VRKGRPNIKKNRQIISKNQVDTPTKDNDTNDGKGVRSKSITQSSPRNKNTKLENVLILQGGGSLGAFGCGVFKALTNNDIETDIVAGTSIGGINAAIIAGSKDEKHPEQALEQFWLELSEGFVNLDKMTPSYLSSKSRFLEEMVIPFGHYYYNWPTYSSNKQRENYFSIPSSSSITDAKEHAIKMKQLKSFYSSAVFGNEKMFRPRWNKGNTLADPAHFAPQNWTYLYDLSPLIKTLDKYIDYDKLKPGGNPNSRLILTAVDILTAEPLTFDSSKQQIIPKHILATSAYPLYNFPWVEVDDGVYAWDGGLLSNTPLREVIDASPVNDKRICIVENYPKKVNALPKNLPEVYHRARDIIFSDKTEHNVAMARVISRYLGYIEELYKVLENNIDRINIDQKHLNQIRRKYKKYKQERGAEIKDIIYVTRDEPFPHMYENADFSPETIKGSIKEGETKTNEILKEQHINS